MAGTKEGGLKAAATNKAKYGEDYYKKIGPKSVKGWEANGRKPRGFSVNREVASAAGRKGGLISKRRKHE